MNKNLATTVINILNKKDAHSLAPLMNTDHDQKWLFKHIQNFPNLTNISFNESEVEAFLKRKVDTKDFVNDFMDKNKAHNNFYFLVFLSTILFLACSFFLTTFIYKLWPSLHSSLAQTIAISLIPSIALMTPLGKRIAKKLMDLKIEKRHEIAIDVKRSRLFWESAPLHTLYIPFAITAAFVYIDQAFNFFPKEKEGMAVAAIFVITSVFLTITNELRYRKRINGDNRKTISNTLEFLALNKGKVEFFSIFIEKDIDGDKISSLIVSTRDNTDIIHI